MVCASVVVRVAASERVPFVFQKDFLDSKNSRLLYSEAGPSSCFVTVQSILFFSLIKIDSLVKKMLQLMQVFFPLFPFYNFCNILKLK